MNLFPIYFRFLAFKLILKNAKKVGILCASPRGCDVALRATWLCHVDARACLRGVDVTRRRVLYLSYSIFI